MSATRANLHAGPRTSEQWFRDLLACPDCGDPLRGLDLAADECRCGYRTSIRAVAGGEQLDLRPRKPTPREVSLARTAPCSVDGELARLDTTKPKITYSGPQPIRDSRELLSAVMGGLSDGAKVLDLGCGPRDQAPCFDSLGCCYVGVDVHGEAADLLADAHALPFLSNAFDCVFSYAVLEHLWSPNVALREVERVLKPGGVYVGTVSQGEPFHASYFHCTAWGLLSLLVAADLQAERLWAGPDTLVALARMGRYPRVIRALLASTARLDGIPFLAPRRWAGRSEKDRELDAIHQAGSLCFVASKPSAFPASRRASAAGSE